MFGSGRGGMFGGEMIGISFSNPVGTWRVWDVCLCLGCGGVGGGWRVSGLVHGIGEWCCAMSVCVVSLEYLCRWHVQISVYCAHGYLHILGAPSVQSCCTLCISASCINL